MEAERKALADERHREPIIAALLDNLGLLAACLLPLLLCAYLLRGLRQEPVDRDLAELLTTELVADSPALLPSAKRFGKPSAQLPSAQSSPGLPSAQDCES